jgi:hypothetical protein
MALAARSTTFADVDLRRVHPPSHVEAAQLMAEVVPLVRAG